MPEDKFAVLSKRARNRRAVMSEPSLEELVRSMREWDGVPTADKYLAVEYQNSGYIEIARADDPDQLGSMVRQKVGMR